MLGTPTSVPFYVSAAAQAKLGHPDGGLSISRACGSEDVIQMISHYVRFLRKALLTKLPQLKTIGTNFM